MRQVFWRAILSAFDDIDRMVAELSPHVFAEASDSTEGGVLSPATQTALRGLHEDARARVSRLRVDLSEAPVSDHMALMLVLSFDERIIGRLPESVRLGWPLLQLEWLGSSNGGDEFYRLTDRLIDEPSTPSELFEVIYFCLLNGFVGRYANNLSGVDEYKERLRGRISAPSSAGAERQRQANQPLGTVRSPLWRYAAAVAVVILCNLLLLGISN